MEIAINSKNLLASGGFLLLTPIVGAQRRKFGAEGFCVSTLDLGVPYSLIVLWLFAHFQRFSSLVRRIHLRYGIGDCIPLPISRLDRSQSLQLNTLSELLTESDSFPIRGNQKVVSCNMFEISILRFLKVGFLVGFFGWHSPCE
jgi:hypothetical protein